MSNMKDQYQHILKSADTPGGASAETIARAEQDLGVAFPSSYRKFLDEYGAAMGSGYEIAGVFTLSDDKPPMWRNVVAATNQTRRLAGSNLPKSLLTISGDGASVTYYLDASDQKESPVIAYGPGVDGERVAESFEEFVVKLANGNLNV